MSKLMVLHDDCCTLINPEEIVVAYGEHNEDGNYLHVDLKNGSCYTFDYRDYDYLLDDLTSLYM